MLKTAVFELVLQKFGNVASAVSACADQP